MLVKESEEFAWMSNKFSQNNSIQGPGSRTRRKMSGDRQQALSKTKCKELIQDMLISTGQREMLKRLVQSRLAQSGWTYIIRNKYVEYIKQKGIDSVNVSHMVADTVSKGVDIFPEEIKTEISKILLDFASEYITLDDNALPPVETDSMNGHTEVLQYQNKDTTPEPGLGFNVTPPELALSRTPSPVSVPRPLTPQPPIPILRPETVDNEIKVEVQSEPDDDEGLSSEAEAEDIDEEEEADDDVVKMNLNEDSEEELMDV